jgi:hypothetical protein
MVHHRHAAASVPWAAIEEAIKANPQRSTALQTGAASASIAAIPVEAAVGWLPGWTEDACPIGDGVALSLWIRDPMYRVAVPAIRRSMEMEEAADLLHASEGAWKTHNGRVRGWIRKHLEEDLRLRAGGGEAAPDAWLSVQGNKRAAHLLDYICIMRGIRVALWWPEKKTVTVIPLTGGSTTLVQLNCDSGRLLLNATAAFQIPAKEWPDLHLTVADISWTPPACAPSIGAQTVQQIFERIQAMPGGVGAVRTGGRVSLWNYLMWLTLKASLAGIESTTPA